ncbi:hypothetical protein [Novosphingobium clariflavum]|uniref:Uncharacterized protein n=1 Tax=Novosphingobium clariflavum TaxID=2029884 RepID=A0ABV6SDI6_9SPHN|nr:hypothetical protein [Novosphingobium clariflavum]
MDKFERQLSPHCGPFGVMAVHAFQELMGGNMGWPWSKKKAAATTPETVTSNNFERYAGKPMLRLLELYVLWSLDNLSEDDVSRLEAMTPKLTSTFGGDGTWHNAIATTMELPENMPELIREMWTKNQQIADKNNVELLAQQFAEMFVDNNLI